MGGDAGAAMLLGVFGSACALLLACGVILVVANKKKTTGGGGSGGGGSQSGGSGGASTTVQAASNPADCPAYMGFKPCSDAAFNKPAFDPGTNDDPGQFGGKCCMFGNSVWDPAKTAANKRLQIALTVVQIAGEIALGAAVPVGGVLFDTLTNAVGGGVNPSGVSVKCGGATPDYKRTGKNYVYTDRETVSGKSGKVAYTANDGCPLVNLDPAVAAYISDADWVSSSAVAGGQPCNPAGGATPCSFQTDFSNYNPYAKMVCKSAPLPGCNTSPAAKRTTPSCTFVSCKREGANVNSKPAYRDPPLTQEQLRTKYNLCPLPSGGRGGYQACPSKANQGGLNQATAPLQQANTPPAPGKKCVQTKTDPGARTATCIKWA